MATTRAEDDIASIRERDAKYKDRGANSNGSRAARDRRHLLQYIDRMKIEREREREREQLRRDGEGL